MAKSTVKYWIKTQRKTPKAKGNIITNGHRSNCKNKQNSLLIYIFEQSEQQTNENMENINNFIFKMYSFYWILCSLKQSHSYFQLSLTTNSPNLTYNNFLFFFNFF